jgi:hypothetical protein
MKLQLTDDNFKKLEKILSIKKRVLRYRLVILILLFLIIIPLLFFKYYEHTPENRNGFIALSVFGLLLILRAYFGPLSSVQKVLRSFITVFNNEGSILQITTADGLLHSFSKHNTSFDIVTGTPFYWGDLYGSIFSPPFFEYDWSVPEKSIYKVKLNNENYIIYPALFTDYKALALEIIDVSKECKAVTH